MITRNALILAMFVLGLAGRVQAEPAVEIHLAHSQRQTSASDAVSVTAAAFKDILESQSNGAVIVRMHPESRLGGNREMAKLVEHNVIQTALITVGGVAPFYPMVAVTQVPFLIPDRAVARQVYDGPFGQALAADMAAKTGFEILGFADPSGFQIITNSSRPIVSAKDMAGLKIRAVPGFSALDAMIRGMGATPVKVSSKEERNALSSGVVDGQSNPAAIILAQRFDDVQKFATLTNHLYSPYVWVFNQDAFRGLSPEIQSHIRAAATKAIALGTKAAEDWENSESGIRLLCHRLKCQDLDAARRAEFAAVTQPVVLERLQDNLGPDGQDWITRFQDAVAKKAH
ncbi:TRAP transporter substrate-binding protein DctP [Paramagnetospirillum kuznetsovii]|nr:TRAP transporter substrate-binding protein DctP [Paramagnetospirillum kuznetsovii]